MICVPACDPALVLATMTRSLVWCCLLIVAIPHGSAFRLRTPTTTKFATNSKKHSEIRRLKWQKPQQKQQPSTALFTAATTTTTSTAPNTVELQDGLVKTITTAGDGDGLQVGDVAIVRYSCYLPEKPNTAPFSRSGKQRVVVGDGSMIDGWEKAIRTMKIGERSIIRINDPDLAYGTSGVPPVVPPNAVVELDLEILDAQPATANIDFDSLGMTEESAPSTPKAIAAAYEARMAARAAATAGEEELEGLEYWIKKFQSSYFFGLFEGETGERPPWFLRPVITFPLAFLIIGLAFYVSLRTGAISERGSQVTDELDQIILSSVPLPISTASPAVVAALAAAIVPSIAG